MLVLHPVGLSQQLIGGSSSGCTPGVGAALEQELCHASSRRCILKLDSKMQRSGALHPVRDVDVSVCAALPTPISPVLLLDELL